MLRAGVDADAVLGEGLTSGFVTEAVEGAGFVTFETNLAASDLSTTTTIEAPYFTKIIAQKVSTVPALLLANRTYVH